MHVDPAIWPTLSRLLDEWLDLPPQDRPVWLQGLGSEYSDVIPVLRELIEKHSETQNVLSQLPRLHIQSPIGQPDGFQAGDRVGRYRLIRELGVGGMGVVWLAESTDDLKRVVALKLPRFSPHNAILANRFERERDILAQLTHPHIARLYDAGVTAGGQRYLAMEYVNGEPITTYCDRHRLDIKARLSLFLQVFSAVQYAHSTLIVHRDLKPSNILVTEDGQVQLVDFGIAKLLEEGEASETELTRMGGRAMTPHYASPEQVKGDRITTATDVHALGVVLYELLAGERPFKPRHETAASIEDAILNVEPLPPSRIAMDASRAEARSQSARRIATTLAGDIDTILLKSLRKDPQHRYATADAFAQDITRYLRGDAVLARPESVWYRTRKFVARNRLAVASSLIVFIALALGLGVSLWQGRVAQLARRHAESEAATSKALNDFLQHDLLAQASVRAQSGPAARPNPDLKVREALDRASAAIGDRFASQPAVEASLRHTIAETYSNLGMYPEAQSQFESALELRRSTLGSAHPDTITTMVRLGSIYGTLSKYADADRILTESLELQRRIHGENDPAILDNLNGLAVLANKRGDYARAETLMTELLETQRRQHGEDHPDTMAMMNNLATFCLNQGKYPRAEQLYKRAAELKTKALGPEHPSTLSSLSNLAIVYRDEGKYAESETLLIRVLEIRTRVVGGEHPETLNSLSSLGLVFMAEGRHAEAEKLLNQVLETRQRVLGKENSTTLASVNNLAELAAKEGKLREAESLFKELLDARRRVLGPLHPNTIHSIASLGSVKLQQAHYSDAETLLREAVMDYEKTNSDDWRRYYAQRMLGIALDRLGRVSDGKPFLDAGDEGLSKHRSSIPADYQWMLDRVAYK